MRHLSEIQAVRNYIVSDAGLEAIEWGGDIHLPPGDLRQAREIRRMSDEAGLRIVSYGSYYKVRFDSNFSEVLETALELGASSIRIWAGNHGSHESDEAWWHKMVEETKCISNLSRQSGMRIAFEYHNNTLVDSKESAMNFMQGVNCNNVSLYWQPQLEKNAVENLQILTSLSPWVTNIHVFHYVNNEQTSLQEGKQDWSQYLSTISAVVNDRYILLEFVKNGECEQFIKDAQVLRSLVQQMKTSN